MSTFNLYQHDSEKCRYQPHRPDWNDPYKNFEKIRTLRPSASGQQSEVRGQQSTRAEQPITAQTYPEHYSPGERSAFDLGVVQARKHGRKVGNPFRKEVAEWAAWNAGAASVTGKEDAR